MKGCATKKGREKSARKDRINIGDRVENKKDC